MSSTQHKSLARSIEQWQNCDPHAMAAEIMHLNDEHISDTKFIDVEICGPVRPHWPDWGKHRKTVCVNDDEAPAKRWKYMRDWTVKQIKQGGAA